MEISGLSFGLRPPYFMVDNRMCVSVRAVYTAVFSGDVSPAVFSDTGCVLEDLKSVLVLLTNSTDA